MSDYLIKSLLAVLLVGAGLAASLSMMARFGRPGDEARAERLRRLHKAAGWIYVTLLAPLAALGIDFISEMGDGLSTRGALHFVLAAALLAVVLLKVLIVKSYRQSLRFAPALGMTLLALTLVIFVITAVFSFVHKLAAP
jgi:hypothetical protein